MSQNNIVIDTSVIIAVVANEPIKPILIEQTQNATLLSPHSVEWEIGNAFSAMFKRRRITIAQAIQAIAIYRQIPLRFVDIELEESVRLADALDIYAYDAYLIRCAQKYKCSLLTLDKGLQFAAERASVNVIEIK